MYNYAKAAKWTPRIELQNSVRVRLNFKPQFTDPSGNPMLALLSVMKMVKIADPKALLLPWVEEGLSVLIEVEDIQIKSRVSVAHFKKKHRCSRYLEILDLYKKCIFLIFLSNCPTVIFFKMFGTKKMREVRTINLTAV